MSVWRRKALELFYDMRMEIQGKEDTIYTVFFALLPRVRGAHARNDIEELKKIYGYAEWCLSQKTNGLWNAAAVAFYEHLVDYEITYKEIPYWIEPDCFRCLSPLFKIRISDNKFHELIDMFNQVNHTEFPYDLGADCIIKEKNS